jgi:hypothetical protein
MSTWCKDTGSCKLGMKKVLCKEKRKRQIHMWMVRIVDLHKPCIWPNKHVDFSNLFLLAQNFVHPRVLHEHASCIIYPFIFLLIFSMRILMVFYRDVLRGWRLVWHGEIKNIGKEKHTWIRWRWGDKTEDRKTQETYRRWHLEHRNRNIWWVAKGKKEPDCLGTASGIRKGKETKKSRSGISFPLFLGSFGFIIIFELWRNTITIRLFWSIPL